VNLPADQICDITGISAVTPLGLNLDTTWPRLLAGERIVDHTRLVGIKKITSRRVSDLAILAATDAIQNANWGREILQSAQTALLIGTSKGPVDAWLVNGEISDAAGSFGLHQVAHDVASYFQFGSGPCLTLANACSSGLHAIVRGAMLIAENRVSRALVVSAESSMHPLFIASFDRLGVLARPGIGCRPFCEDREGFVLAESAAAICLERCDAGRASVTIKRLAVASDATHLVAIDAQSRALQHVLTLLKSDQPPDVVHAHGTGTKLNDAQELAAIEAIVQPEYVYSHKGALGHSLGAAGLLALALSVQMHRTSTIPPHVPNIPILPSHRAILSPHAVSHHVKQTITLATGFGGGIAGVRLSSE